MSEVFIIFYCAKLIVAESLVMDIGILAELSYTWIDLAKYGVIGLNLATFG